MRAALTVLHRWLGLAAALFLVVAGVTGSLLAWYDELEAALSPQLYRTAAACPGSAAPLDPLVLRERALAQRPGHDISAIALQRAAGRTAWYFIEPLPGQPAPAEDQVFLDPCDGRIVGARNPGDLMQGTVGLMPFVYRLHYALALGDVGVWVMGVVSLAWTVDCAIGALLTLPRRRGGGRWLARWWPAWRVRLAAGGYRLHYDMHRAGGLWTWAMLLALAWSSVAFNLPSLYEPAMRAFLAHQPRLDAVEPSPRAGPPMAWPAALDQGRRWMAASAARHGFVVEQETWLALEATAGVFRYRVRSNLDVDERHGRTEVVFDAATGALRGEWLPTGAAAGDSVTSWLTGLHTAAVWGWPMQAFVCAMGVVVTVLAVTGIVVWARKRRARTAAAVLRVRAQSGIA